MKKQLASLCLAAMVGSIAPAVYASELPNPSQTEQQPPAEENTETPITALSLETAIDRALNSNLDLLTLSYNLEATKNNKLDVSDDLRDTKFDIRDLEDDLDDLKDAHKKNDANNFGDRKKAMDSLDAYEDKIEALEDAIRQVESGELKLTIRDNEAKEGIKLQITSEYLNLLTSKNQIAYTNQALATTNSEITKLKRYNELGLVSNYDVEQAERQKTNLESSLEKLEKQYNYDYASLLIDLDVPYNPDITLEPVTYEIAAVETPEESIESLVENSFKMKTLKEDLELATYERDRKYEDYEEDHRDVTKYALQQYDAQVKAAEVSLAAAQEELTEKITKMYDDADMLYLTYQDAVRKVENVKRDNQVLATKQQLGLVSKHDVDNAQLDLEKAEFELSQAQANYFVLCRSVEAIKKGLIQ